jgi:hypothetical protein
MDFVSDLFSQLTALGPEMLVALIVIVLGYVLRFIPAVPNRFIPLACIVLGGILYPLLAPLPKADLAVRHPMTRLALIGILIGFLAWIGHNKFLKPIEDKVPFLKGLLDDDGAKPPAGTP